MNCRIFATIIALMVPLAAGIAFPPGAWGAAPEVKLLSTDDYGVSLELTLPDFVIEEQPQSVDFSPPELTGVRPTDGACREIALPGWATTSQAGYPALPVAAVLIQVPQAGEIGLEVLESDSTSSTVAAICPVPRLSVLDDGNLNTESVRDPAVYSSSSFFPGALAEVSSRHVLRDTAVARIMIRPFQWNPVTKEFLYHRKIHLRVNFENPLPQPGEPLPAWDDTAGEDVFEGLKRHSMLNYRESAGTGSSRVAASPQAEVQDYLSETNSNRLKIEIKENGIYQLSYDDLVSAGIDNTTTVDPTTFRLFNRDKEVAIGVVSKALHHFNAGDYLEFYAQGINTPFTDTNVYWLWWGGGAGKRIGKISGKVTGTGKKQTSFSEVLRLEENHIMWDGTPGAPDQDYWFWQKITAPKTQDYSLSVPSPVKGQTGARLRMGYQGRSSSAVQPDHHTRITLNGTLLGDDNWDGDTEHLQEFKIPAGILAAGKNTLTLAAPGDTGAVTDVFYLNWMEFRYARKFEAVADRLAFAVQGKGTIEVEVRKLSRQSIRIYEVTDPYAVKQLTSFSKSADGSGFKAAFEATFTGKKVYHVATARAVKHPEKVSLWKPVNLKSASNGADFILITPAEFLDAVEPLCAYRRNQGLRVKKISIENVYNEFSAGLVDPAAIRDFLKTAYTELEAAGPYLCAAGRGCEHRLPGLPGHGEKEPSATASVAYRQPGADAG